MMQMNDKNMTRLKKLAGINEAKHGGAYGQGYQARLNRDHWSWNPYEEKDEPEVFNRWRDGWDDASNAVFHGDEVVEDTLNEYKPGVSVLTRELPIQTDDEPDVGLTPDEIAGIQKDVNKHYGIEMKVKKDRVVFKTAKIKTLAKIFSRHVDTDGDIEAILDIPPSIRLWSSANNNRNSLSSLKENEYSEAEQDTYYEGMQAFHNGETLDDNPHTDGLLSTAWKDGWQEFADDPNMNESDGPQIDYADDGKSWQADYDDYGPTLAEFTDYEFEGEHGMIMGEFPHEMSHKDAVVYLYKKYGSDAGGDGTLTNDWGDETSINWTWGRHGRGVTFGEIKDRLKETYYDDEEIASSAAYADGWDANEQGLSDFDNPYDEHSEPFEHAAWYQGWEDASTHEDDFQSTLGPRFTIGEDGKPYEQGKAAYNKPKVSPDEKYKNPYEKGTEEFKQWWKGFVSAKNEGVVNEDVARLKELAGIEDEPIIEDHHDKSEAFRKGFEARLNENYGYDQHAYDEGHLAGRTEAPVTENPYDDDEPSHWAWQDGWYDGHSMISPGEPLENMNEMDHDAEYYSGPHVSASAEHEEGGEAFYVGIPYEHNPYERNSWEWKDWNDGWDGAFHEKWGDDPMGNWHGRNESVDMNEDSDEMYDSPVGYPDKPATPFTQGYRAFAYTGEIDNPYHDDTSESDEWWRGWEAANEDSLNEENTGDPAADYTTAYDQGWDAYIDGKPVQRDHDRIQQACPYKKDKNMRQGWFKGWYDASEKLGESKENEGKNMKNEDLTRLKELAGINEGELMYANSGDGATQQGIDAYYSGEPISACPYDKNNPRGNPDYYGWRTGWHDAWRAEGYPDGRYGGIDEAKYPAQHQSEYDSPLDFDNDFGPGEYTPAKKQMKNLKKFGPEPGAHTEGFNAYLNGKSKKSNPYIRDHLKGDDSNYYDWDGGWYTAHTLQGGEQAYHDGQSLDTNPNSMAPGALYGRMWKAAWKAASQGTSLLNDIKGKNMNEGKNMKNEDLTRLKELAGIDESLNELDVPTGKSNAYNAGFDAYEDGMDLGYGSSHNGMGYDRNSEKFADFRRGYRAAQARDRKGIQTDYSDAPTADENIARIMGQKGAQGYLDGKSKNDSSNRHYAGELGWEGAEAYMTGKFLNDNPVLHDNLKKKAWDAGWKYAEQKSGVNEAAGVGNMRDDDTEAFYNIIDSQSGEDVTGMRVRHEGLDQMGVILAVTDEDMYGLPAEFKFKTDDGQEIITTFDYLASGYEEDEDDFVDTSRNVPDRPKVNYNVPKDNDGARAYLNGEPIDSNPGKSGTYGHTEWEEEWKGAKAFKDGKSIDDNPYTIYYGSNEPRFDTGEPRLHDHRHLSWKSGWKYASGNANESIIEDDSLKNLQRLAGINETKKPQPKVIETENRRRRVRKIMS